MLYTESIEKDKMKKLNKKGIKFDNMLVGFLILTLFIIGGTLMMVDMNDSYEHAGVNISTDEYINISNSTSEMFGLSEDADEKMFQGDISDTDSWESMTKGSYSAMRLVGGSYDLFWGTLTAVGTRIGVPPVVIKTAFVAFVIVIVFSVIYMIFRFIPR